MISAPARRDDLNVVKEHVTVKDAPLKLTN